MKLLSLVLMASLAASGYAYAQTAEQSPTKPPASTPPASSSEGAESPGHACKKEIEKLCGRRAHGDEKQTCIKENLDMKKFSADCQTKLSSGKKPGS